jgi:serine-type D-Ala-D-Ala carboxypeptidase/endopeptidase (penicillin-binding protein 4)
VSRTTGENAQPRESRLLEGDGGHVRSGRWLRRTTTLLVVAVMLAAFASYRFDLGDRWLHDQAPSPVTEPAKVLPPPGLSLPAARGVAAVAAVSPTVPADPSAVRRALAGLLRAKKLGRHVVVDVAQAADGKSLFRHGTGRVIPASTMKLLTTTAALSTLGPDHRFVTRVVATPSSPRIVLVGGGDPFLLSKPAPAGTYPARADVTTLARATAKALRAVGRSRVRLGYDSSLFSGPAFNPHWPASYRSDVVSPITALWVDEARAKGGYGYSSDPAGDAGQVFAQALRRQGIKVLGKVTPTTAPSPAQGGRTLSSVRGAPLAEVAQHVLEVSDNEGAEVLAHQVAVAEGRPATFSGGAAAVRSVLRRLGIDTTGDLVYDGSGLSRDDRLAPSTLLRVLAADSSAAHSQLRPVVTGLPVAGFTGSLKYRFDKGDPGGLGTVRAKTGTLMGVHGLAGTATSRDGVVMLFVVVADRVKPLNSLDARQLVDRLAAALGGCTCAATP